MRKHEVARSRSHGLHLGAVVTVAEPGRGRLATAGVTTGVGSTEAVHSGPSVRVYTKGRRHASFGVGVARLTIDGANDQDERQLRGEAAASAAGYDSASFRAP